MAPPPPYPAAVDVRRRAQPAPAVSAGTSAAATSSITAGTSSSATTSWICGAARAAASAWRWAARARASWAWAARVGASGAPWRSARWSAAASGAIPAAGARCSSSSIARAAGTPRADRSGGAAQLGREQAGMAAADLRERSPWCEPGRDRHSQQVEHVGELGLDRSPARPGAPAEVGVGCQVRGGRCGEQQCEAEASGRVARRGGGQRERGGRRSRLDRHDVGDRGVETGGGDAHGERARRAQARAAAEPAEERDRTRPARLTVAPSGRPQREHVRGAVGRQHGGRGREQRHGAHALPRSACLARVMRGAGSRGPRAVAGPRRRRRARPGAAGRARTRRSRARRARSARPPRSAGRAPAAR